MNYLNHCILICLANICLDGSLILFRFKSIVGIGVGAGAYILAKFAVSQKLFIVIYETTIAFPFRCAKIFYCLLRSADLP